MAQPKPAAHRTGRGLGRRRFLTFLVAAPTLTVAARFGFDALSEATAAPSLPALSELSDLGDVIGVASMPTMQLMVLEVTEDGRVRFELPRVEVGQGITTSIAMIVAEELDARLDDVDVVLSDSRPELQFNQFTAASTTVRLLWDPLRQMAADARARLVQAAADRWGLDPEQLTTHDTAVWAPDGRSLGYGVLSADARETDAEPAEPKPASEYTVVGEPQGRTDAWAIVTGTAQYAMDLQVEGALPTVVARPPTINGTVASVDETEARSLPGVVAVTQIPSGVAVSAETFYDALRGVDALDISWNAGPVAGLSDAEIRNKLRGAVQPLAAPKLQGSHLDASFDFAFLNHAPMEVESAVADVRSDGTADIWMPAQSPIYAQRAIAEVLGISEDAVAVHVTRAGGSFGRRLFFDTGLEAARVSQAIGRPVKLMRTREDDMKHGRMRPAYHHRIRASYAAGEVLSFEHRLAGVAVDLSHGLGEALTATLAQTAEPVSGAGLYYFNFSQAVPYNVGVTSQTIQEVPLDVPTGSFRSVYSGTVRTSEEIVMDRLADKMGMDPLDFRRSVVKDSRGAVVLDKVAEAAEWGKQLPAGYAQGIAYHTEYRSHVACVVQINATEQENPRVTKVILAVDVGQVVNPQGLEAQLMSGTMDAIATVLRAGVHIDDGAVRESSFGDYHWTKHRDAPPEFEVHIIPSTQAPGGAGELAVPAAAGAVANAYARATGTEPSSFPISF
ncbi:MAG: molybdopterin-dependent oxidoreductase [Actinophytocola sp.]|nr:molybdopterin-dependent oxidoreductase [Actinophytocola sp.]